jgi:hypothetical protein
MFAQWRMYFAIAPNQRCYAAGARPDPADHASYRVNRLIGDALDIVSAVGHGDRRFHLVGHWIGWRRSRSCRARIRSHFARALEMPDGEPVQPPMLAIKAIR